MSIIYTHLYAWLFVLALVLILGPMFCIFFPILLIPLTVPLILELFTIGIGYFQLSGIENYEDDYNSGWLIGLALLNFILIVVPFVVIVSYVATVLSKGKYIKKLESGESIDDFRGRLQVIKNRINWVRKKSNVVKIVRKIDINE